MKLDTPELNDWSFALPVYEEKPIGSTLEQKRYGGVPYVNEGILGPEKQAAVSFVAGIKEQSGYGDIARAHETGPLKFSDILLAPRKLLGMAHNFATGTLRVGAEAGLDVAAGPNKQAQSVTVTSPVLKFLLGTDESGALNPLSQQVSAAVTNPDGTRKGIHEAALGAGLLAVGKGLESMGPMLGAPKPTNILLGGVERTGARAFTIPGIRPAIQNVLRRTFDQSVSPVVSWAGGADKFAALASRVEPLTGKTGDQLARDLEGWARKTYLEKNNPEITPDKVGVEAYNKALFEKVSDEQALSEMQSFAHGKTIEEQLVNMDKAVAADQRTLSIKDRGTGDILSNAEVAAQQAAKAVESDARKFASDTIAQMKKEKTLSPDANTTAMEDGLYRQRKAELQSALTKGPESPQMFDKNDLMVGPDERNPSGASFNPIPMKIIDPVRRAVANEWVTRSASADTHISEEFFSQFPEYRPYADQIYQASEYNAAKGTINPTKFQDAVKNVEERFTYHFKEGTQGAADATAAREQGYLVGQAPTHFKGGEPKTYTARISEEVPFEVRNQKMSPVGRFLTNSGLSPVGIEKGTIARAQVQKFQEFLAGFKSKEIDVEGSYAALRQLAFDKMRIGTSKFGMAHRAEGIFSLSAKDIEDGLRVSSDAARVYREAIQKSRNVPVALQGLGPAAVNALRSMPVIGPLMSSSIYLTNLGHFTISPAHALRYVTKTGLFSLGEGSGVNLGRIGTALRKLDPGIKLPNLFGGEKYQLPGLKTLIGEDAKPSTLMLIEDAFYSKKGLDAIDVVNDSDLTSAVNFKQIAGSRNHNVFLEGIKYDERQTTANIFYSIGKRNGLRGNIDSVVRQVMSDEKIFNQASDVAEGIVGYKSGVLQSPLMKTINIIAYPLRFDTKVAMLTSNFIERQNPLVQKSIIQGAMNMVEWSQSEGGKQWIKDNDAFVKLFNNLIPYGSIAEAIGATAKGEFTDIGLIGGLPFGFIQSILTQEGIIKNDYVNPKTNREGYQTVPTSLSEGGALAVSGLLRHFFPLPIYTFSLQKIHDQDVRPFLYPDMYRGLLGQDKYPYGAPTPYNRPRPEQLFPIDPTDTTSTKAWKFFLQSFLGERTPPETP